MSKAEKGRRTAAEIVMQLIHTCRDRGFIVHTQEAPGTRLDFLTCDVLIPAGGTPGSDPEFRCGGFSLYTRGPHAGLELLTVWGVTMPMASELFGTRFTGYPALGDTNPFNDPVRIAEWTRKAQENRKHRDEHYARMDAYLDRADRANEEKST